MRKSAKIFDVVNTMEEGIDYNKYAYVVCECMPFPYGIRIPRNGNPGHIQLQCPKCGKTLGLIIVGQE